MHFAQEIAACMPFSCLVMCPVASVNMSRPCGNFNPLSVTGRVAFRSSLSLSLSLLRNPAAVSHLHIDTVLSIWHLHPGGFVLIVPFLLFAFHDWANGSVLTPSPALSFSLNVGEYHTHTFVCVPLPSQHKKGCDVSVFCTQKQFPRRPQRMLLCCLISAWLQ